MNLNNYNISIKLKYNILNISLFYNILFKFLI